MNPIQIIGVPLDLGAGRRGVDMGPSAMRIASVGERVSALGRTVTDRGDLSAPIRELCSPGDSSRKYIDDHRGGLPQSLRYGACRAPRRRAAHRPGRRSQSCRRFGGGHGHARPGRRRTHRPAVGGRPRGHEYARHQRERQRPRDGAFRTAGRRTCRTFGIRSSRTGRRSGAHRTRRRTQSRPRRAQPGTRVRSPCLHDERCRPN